MYIVGHCYVAELSRAFPPELPSIDGIASLMLPDYVNCHSWGYENYRSLRGIDGMLVKAHIVADWVVHFGSQFLATPSRVGWAYRRMGLASLFYEEFFENAHDEGLALSPQPSDSKRGFSHSMMEYAIDTSLCRQRWFDSKFEAAVKVAKKELKVAEVKKHLATHGIPSGNVRELEKEIASYSGRLSMARDSEDFALLAAAKKFGLVVSLESADYVRTYMDRILAMLDKKEIDRVCRECAIAIAQSCRGS